MSSETAVLTREELYEKVWSEPLQTLAKRLWLSDVALAKRCRKLQIPLPGRGFWAKKAAGHKVRRRPLSAMAASDARGAGRIVFQRPVTEMVTKQKTAAFSAQEAYEAEVTNRISVGETLRAAHPLVRKTAAAIREGGKAPTDWLGGTAGCLDVQVTRASAARALRLLNAVVKAFERRGWPVTATEEYPWQSCVRILDQRVPFGIRERIKKVMNEPAKPVRSSASGEWYTPYQSKYRDEPTGRLSLVVRSRWSGSKAVEASWDDSPSVRLEERLNEFMLGAFSYAEEWQEWDRRRAENEALRRQEEARRQDELRRRQQEADRRRALEEEADRWSMAKQLRAYLEAIRSTCGPQARIDEDWIDWASRHADILDPLPRRVTALLSERPVETTANREGPI